MCTYRVCTYYIIMEITGGEIIKNCMFKLAFVFFIIFFSKIVSIEYIYICAHPVITFHNSFKRFLSFQEPHPTNFTVPNTLAIVFAKVALCGSVLIGKRTAYDAPICAAVVQLGSLKYCPSSSTILDGNPCP